MQEPRFPDATQIPFADFNGMYAGRSCYVVGRGPTSFDYERFADISDPIFFINDAVSLEQHARSETFFFAHDAQMLVWLNGRIKSTAVLPIDGKVFRQTLGITLHHAGKIAFYRWREENCEDLLTMDRDQMAQVQQLYHHTGTIHSLLHFVWYCGFTRVNFIGCDCEGGYDPRILTVSRSSPSSSYAEIGRVQKLLCTLFNFEAVYQ
jgi:hypothetical protein